MEVGHALLERTPARPVYRAMSRRVRGRAQPLSPSGESMRVVTWSEFYEMCKVLLKKVGEFDAVVGVLRGGYFPAHVLADLASKPLFVIRLESYKGTQKRGKPKVVLPLIGDVSGKRVLLVDDVCDTGETLRAAKELLSLYAPADLKVATLFVKPSCSEPPDAWVEEADEWVLFPWEVGEVVREDPKALPLAEKATGVRLDDILGDSEGS